ncbi:3-deoxy-manno-octulosonate cytidylyltransferase [Halomonas halocynthiae]|uniref:3-deoxy-manno-octulosonate cytidylyltransferase n=1 Tax=Halomonas halocynthiae TaxID=176290 RepID=UPI0003F97B3B|nr:3-deoxy-manno-octulosonate cytidylyltransferase [Halomonas halocynthiae]
MHDFIVVIPSRYDSSRLPGKPLADIGGLPMVQRVWQQTRNSSASRRIVAVDDPRICQALEGSGAEVLMTRVDHPSGTDRLAEVVTQLALPDDAIVVNVQGDEPLIPAALIDQVAALLAADPLASIATLAEPITDKASLFNPNVVKVVVNVQGRALYFSRAPIPWQREGWEGQDDALSDDSQLANGGWLRHVGIYAYRVGFLRAFQQWPPAPLEELEQLEQLRALYHGHAIQVGLAIETHPAGVDTAEDLERVRDFISLTHGGA